MLTRFAQKVCIVATYVSGAYIMHLSGDFPLRNLNQEINNLPLVLFGLLLVLSAFFALADPPIPYKEPTVR